MGNDHNDGEGIVGVVGGAVQHRWQSLRREREQQEARQWGNQVPQYRGAHISSWAGMGVKNKRKFKPSKPSLLLGGRNGEAERNQPLELQLGEPVQAFGKVGIGGSLLYLSVGEVIPGRRRGGRQTTL